MKTNTTTNAVVRISVGTLREEFQYALEHNGYSNPPGRTVCAMNAARDVLAFARLQDLGKVHLRVESDDDYDTSWLDQSADDMTQGNVRAWKAQRKEVLRKLDSWGAICIIGEINVGTEDEPQWEFATSLGGMIGDEIQYAASAVYQEVLSAWRKHEEDDKEEEETREYARRQVEFDPSAPIVAIVPDDAQIKQAHGQTWVQTWTLAAGDSDELIFQHIDGESGKETVRMRWAAAYACSGQGDQSANVAEWIDDDSVVFSEDPEALVRLLRSSGAWTEEELAIVPMETIKQRVFWIAACDIRERPASYFDL